MKRQTTDALKLIDERFFKTPESRFLLEQTEARWRVAERLRDIREAEGLSQQELADRVGTARSVIARIENPGYDRHSMSTLRKVCGAMGYVMQVTFTPSKSMPKARAKAASGTAGTKSSGVRAGGVRAGTEASLARAAKGTKTAKRATGALAAKSKS